MKMFSFENYLSLGQKLRIGLLGYSPVDEQVGNCVSHVELTEDNGDFAVSACSSKI